MKTLIAACLLALSMTACAVDLPPPEAFAHKSSNTAEDRCLQAPACIISGFCTDDGVGRCVAAHDEDCALSKGCQEGGACHLFKTPTRAICAPTVDTDCLQSTYCSTKKLCDLVDNACIQQFN